MKAQASMEFLLTYGWAILLVLLMISSLAYFGVFNIDDMIPNKCFFSAGVNCNEHVVYTSGSETRVNLLLTNNFGETIIPKKINITDMNGNSGCDCQNNCGMSGSWESSSQKMMNFSCFDNIDRVDLRIRITYKLLRGDYDRVVEGQLQSRVE